MAETVPEALPSGTVIGNYEVLRTLGRGGCAITYCAQRLGGGDLVAIKEFFPGELVWRGPDLVPQPRQNADIRTLQAVGEKFYHEAEIVSRFDHPNLVKGLEVFEALGTAFLVMKYESGRSLRQRLRAEHGSFEVTPRNLANLLNALQQGLDYSHARNCLHCDIKPSNIYLGIDNHPVLLDFGAARDTARAIDPSVSGAVNLFTAHYAPYELSEDKVAQIGPWTDIYQLGAVAYRCLTGGKIPDGSERKTNPSSYWPVSRFSPLPPGDWPKAFLEGIDHALAFRPDDRPRSVAKWRESMAPLFASMSRQSDPPPLPSKAREGTVERPIQRDSSPAAKEIPRPAPATTVTVVPPPSELSQRKEGGGNAPSRDYGRTNPALIVFVVILVFGALILLVLAASGN